jgi:hypothetical protein
MSHGRTFVNQGSTHYCPAKHSHLSAKSFSSKGKAPSRSKNDFIDVLVQQPHLGDFGGGDTCAKTSWCLLN